MKRFRSSVPLEWLVTEISQSEEIYWLTSAPVYRMEVCILNTINGQTSKRVNQSIPVFGIDFSAKECNFAERFRTRITKFLSEYYFVETKVRISGQIIRVRLNSTNNLEIDKSIQSLN